MAKIPVPINPIPQVFAGRGTFKVIRSAPDRLDAYCVMARDNKPGEFCVPNADTETALALRAHEYGHLLAYRENMIPLDIHTRAAKAELGEPVLQRAMDLVVNMLMARRGVPDVEKLPLMYPSENEIQPVPMDTAVLGAVAEAPLTDSEGLHRSDYMRLLPPVMQRTLKKHMADVLKYAKPRGANKFLKACLAIQELAGMAREIESASAPGEYGDSDVKTLLRDSEGYFDKTHAVWGAMRIEQGSLTRPSVPRIKTRTPSYAGGFRYPHRLAIPAQDGKAWASKIRYKGATVLMDCSGSMHLSDAQINEFLTLAPSSTIALYSGHHDNGILWIAAKNMRKVASSKDYRPMGGNVIDGPALVWLSKQPGPRYWICDGMVTGIGDRMADNLRLEAALLQAKGKITRFHDIKEFLKAMRVVHTVKPA